MSPTAFVTGASGFVGSRLVRELHKQGWLVHVFARRTSSLEDINDVPVTVHYGDIANSGSVSAVMPSGVNAVFHVAASTNVWSVNNDEQDRINIGGTRELIDAAVKANADRFIYTSSFVTWGFQNVTITEHSPRSEATDWINYIRSKYIAESMVKEAALSGRLDSVILNPALILGPGDRRNLSRIFKLVHLGKLPGMPPGGGSFADVEEVAKAHVQAFHKGGTGERYLLGGEIETYQEVIRIAGEILGKPVPGRATPAWVLRAMARFSSAISLISHREPAITPESAAMITRMLVCDSSRARRELGYRFTPVRQLIRDTIDWMEQAGMLSLEDKSPK